MSHFVSSSRRTAVLVFAELLVTLGAVALLYVFWTLLIADAGARAEQSSAAADLHAQFSRPGTSPTATVSVPQPSTVLPHRGQAFAVLHVPRFGSGWERPVVEGTSMADLDRGAAHYRGTAMPGAIGNFALAGHRLTHGSAFMKIADLHVGDPIVVETATSWYVYRVTASLIVNPDQTDVIDPVPEHPGEQPTQAVLTLTSCSPLFGHTQRYIVHAGLSASSPHAQGPPAV